MSTRTSFQATAIFGLALLAASAAAAPPQAGIERAAPFLAKEGGAWIEDRGCVSCHQVPFLIWSLNAAEREGLSVSPQLEQWRKWAVAPDHFQAPANRDQPRQKTLDGNIDTMYQLLLAADARGQGDVAAQPWAEEFLNHLAAAQQDDGSWKPGGQLPSQKRPVRETAEVTTMWTLLALRLGGPSLAERYDEEQGWRFASSDAESTEWWAARLLLAAASGRQEAVRDARRRLLETQREDGGWGWLTADESDALGTGLAVYALARTGDPQQPPLVQPLAAAADYLRGAQQENGAWPVRGTKKNRRDKVQDTSTYWGTAWAVIGLAELHPSGEPSP